MFKNKYRNYKLKIAFDFDDTLTEPLFFLLAQRLILKGHDVWIMTARTNDEQYMEECDKLRMLPKTAEQNSDLIEVAKELGIENKIIYTNLEDKKEFFFNQGFDILFDDDAEWHCNPICKAGGIAVNI